MFAFDCLFVDGKSLLRQTLAERRAALMSAFPNLRPGHFAVAHSWELPAPGQPPPGTARPAAAGQGMQQGAAAPAEAPAEREEEPMELDASEGDEGAAHVAAASGQGRDDEEGRAAAAEEPVMDLAAEDEADLEGVMAEEEGMAWTDASIEAAIREHLQAWLVQQHLNWHIPRQCIVWARDTVS